MPRFYVEEPGEVGSEIVLRGENARHIAYALRMAVGDRVVLCDGRGTDCLCTLVAFDGERVVARVDERRSGTGESPVAVTLYQACPKGDKLEWIVQKAVELGAASIVPFEGERCVRRPRPDKEVRQTERLCRIAAEAAGQCGRSVLPRVGTPLSFDGMLTACRASELVLFCYEGQGTTPLRALLETCPPPRSIAVIVGPEGGFSEREADAARAAGALLCGLGPRILRCETAPLAALSAILYRYELGEPKNF